MKKIVLAFPSKESMAEFILVCKVGRAVPDPDGRTLTGYFPDAILEIAFRDYGASIDKPPDFILA